MIQRSKRPALIRKGKRSDLPAISNLLQAAFAPSGEEGQLVSEVYEDAEGAFHDWVLVIDDVVTGYVLYTPAFRESQPIGWHLAPVAIRPDAQRQGFGKQLIQATLAAEPVATSSVFVLGDPRFYGLFGFLDVVTARCPFDPGNKHFRALRWTESNSPFTVGYVDAFKAFDEEAAG